MTHLSPLSPVHPRSAGLIYILCWLSFIVLLNILSVPWIFEEIWTVLTEPPPHYASWVEPVVMIAVIGTSLYLWKALYTRTYCIKFAALTWYAVNMGYLLFSTRGWIRLLLSENSSFYIWQMIWLGLSVVINSLILAYLLRSTTPTANPDVKSRGGGSSPRLGVS